MKLRISEDLALNAEAVTETFAVLGRRGSGKTYTAGVLAEELLETKCQVVIIDPLDAWWGLRSSADGKGDGYPVYVFGGTHADAPLAETAGEVLADVVIDSGISAVFSLRHLSKSGARRFVAAFCDRLYQRKGEDAHRTPLHLIVDEADAFVPQHLQNDATSCYGAIDTIVRRGRRSGFGTTLISQRAAVISKDVLTQTEVLIAHQTTGPQDRKALQAWVEAHDTEGKGDDFWTSLASLPRGTAWVWSPGWLDVFRKVKVREKRTFDSSDTPRAGARPVEPKRMTPVDLAQLSSRIQATIEEAKASDPKVLRAELARLRAHKCPESAKVVKESVLSDVAAGKLLTAVERMREVGNRTLAVADGIAMAVREAKARPLPPLLTVKREPYIDPKSFLRPERTTAIGGLGLKRGARDLLRVLAMFPGQTVPRSRMAMYAGVKPTTGTFSNYLSSLRIAGYAEDAGDGLRATEAGLAEAGEVPQPRTSAEILELWNRKLKAGARRMLEIIVRAYPKSVTREAIARELDVSDDTGTFSNYLSNLRTAGLVAEGRGDPRAADELFAGDAA